MTWWKLLLFLDVHFPTLSLRSRSLFTSPCYTLVCQISNAVLTVNEELRPISHTFDASYELELFDHLSEVDTGDSRHQLTPGMRHSALASRTFFFINCTDIVTISWPMWKMGARLWGKRLGQVWGASAMDQYARRQDPLCQVQGLGFRSWMLISFKSEHCSI